MRRTIFIFAAVLAAAAAAAARAQVQSDPEIAFRAVAEAGIRDALIDPESARFKWDKPAILLTDFKANRWAKPIPGAIGFECGKVNSRNRMGGYSGFATFWVAIQGGVVVAHAIDDDIIDRAAASCKQYGL